MKQLRIHIVSFQNPFPPNYGGVIDTYYRIKALHDAGVYVTLHTYCYGNREPLANDLLQIADEVIFYNRQTGWKSQLSLLPYIVYSRRDAELLKNLRKDNEPILFEGLHTTYFLSHPDLKKRLKIVRAHNIEHTYYSKLSSSPDKFYKRLYYFIESIKLKHYESQLHHADAILALNENEVNHFKVRFPATDVIFSPVFYDDTPSVVRADGNYILYHGNLSVAENVTSAQWIISNIASKMPNIDFIIAGYSPAATLQKAAERFDNVQLIPSPSEQEMDALIDHAKAHLLITFQSTGVKLKLINILHRNGLVIANKAMVDGSGLESNCRIAETPEEIINLINSIFAVSTNRTQLPPYYSPQNNIKRLINFISLHQLQR